MLHSLSCLTKRPCTICSLFRRSYFSPFNNRPTMNWSANVLSAATSDTEPTIIIEFDRAKYIFNVGENTNRAFCQNRPNWKKTKCFFLTSLGTQRASGLPGFILTLADASTSKVDAIGPQGLTHFIASMRNYVTRDYFTIKPTEVPINPDFSGSSAPLDAVYKDENVTVFALPIIPVDPAKEPTANASSVVSDAGLQPSLPNTSKRKRAPSPFSPSKHPQSASNDASSSACTPSTTERKYPTIESLLTEPTFDPYFLRGATAQEWRDFLVQELYKKTNHTPQEKFDQTATNGASIRVQGKQSSRTFMPVQRRIIPPHILESRLPPFSFPYRMVTNTPETKPTLAYVVVGPRIRGKFDAARAEALRVPNGRQRSELISGHAITFMAPDGLGGQGMIERTVQPEEVVGPSESPSVVVVLDTPTIGHIPVLTSTFTESSFFAKFRSKCQEDISEYAVRVVFHLCGEGVLEDERYKTFMNGFAPDVEHIISSREHGNDPISFTSAAFNQLRLSQLDADIFRLPKFRADAKKNLESIPGLPLKTSFMCPNARHYIRPFKPPIYDQASDEQTALQSSTPVSLPDLTAKRFSEAKEAVTEFSKTDQVTLKPGSDVVITPLGTSSACPTKFRNVSSTLIQIPSWGNVLLDAGEGTWGQFVRNFGTDTASSNACEALRNLKCIFISHLHADHHAGMAKILSMRYHLDPPPTEPLYLIANSNVFLYLHEYSDIEDLGLDDPSGNGVKCILSDSMQGNNNTHRTFGDRFHWLDVANSHRLAVDLNRTLGLQNFATVQVLHTKVCYGVVMKHLEGWSIVFSGDTLPSDRLIKAGKDATLLIHEASMADDEIERAKSKRHSTFGQAVDVGRRMNAQNTLLTHFSARYPKMPPSAAVPTLNAHGETSREPILALAFDHASIAIGDMWKMNLYLPAIEQSFSDIVEGDDEILHME